MNLTFTLNRRPCVTDVPDHWTVLDLLRDGLSLMGTKYGCGEGVCGTCTVLADGRPLRACLVLAAHLRGRELVTVEGLETGGQLDPAPDRVRGAQSGPVRLLHARNAALREGAPGRAPGADGGGGARRCPAICAAAPAYTKIVEAVLAARAGPEVGVRLHPFRLVEAESLREALDAAAGLEGEARLVAGGTAIVPMIRLGLVKPDRLISLNRLSELTRIRLDGMALELGAMATLADIERSSVVRDGWPLLAEAARRVATPAIRTSGTIGGNLAYAEAASIRRRLSCVTTPRCAWPARRQTRALPVAQFFRSFYEAALEPGEIVTAVRVPAPPKGARRATSGSRRARPRTGRWSVSPRWWSRTKAGAAARRASASAASLRPRSAPPAPRRRFAERR